MSGFSSIMNESGIVKALIEPVSMAQSAICLPPSVKAFLQMQWLIDDVCKRLGWTTASVREYYLKINK